MYYVAQKKESAWLFKHIYVTLRRRKNQIGYSSMFRWAEERIGLAFQAYRGTSTVTVIRSMLRCAREEKIGFHGIRGRIFYLSWVTVI
jgi:hypothetical protein